MNASPDKLSSQVHEFLSIVKKLPTRDFKPSNTIDWGPKEILIHLAFWHKQYVSIITSLLMGVKPLLLKGTFKSINAMAEKEYYSLSVIELISSLEQSQKELDLLGQNSQTWKLEFPFREGSELWKYSEFIDVIAGHVQLHRLQLEKSINK